MDRQEFSDLLTLADSHRTEAAIQAVFTTCQDPKMLAAAEDIRTMGQGQFLNGVRSILEAAAKGQDFGAIKIIEALVGWENTETLVEYCRNGDWWFQDENGITNPAELVWSAVPSA